MKWNAVIFYPAALPLVYVTLCNCLCILSEEELWSFVSITEKMSFFTKWLITSKASIRTTASWQDCEIERKRRNKAYRQVAGVLLPLPLWFTLSLTFELVWTVLALFVFRVLETQAIWNFSVHVTDSFNKCNDAIFVSHGDIATTRWQICISRYPVSAVCVGAFVFCWLFDLSFDQPELGVCRKFHRAGYQQPDFTFWCVKTKRQVLVQTRLRLV